MNLSRLESLLRERIGLDAVSLGASALPRAVERRSAARGLSSPAAYSGLAETDGNEWSALVGELVVPESWFFRGGWELFEYLARWIRQTLHDSPNGRVMRILSAPCSTGEEPYSLVLALEKEGVPPTRCQIDGVDLARDHLLRAVAGRFTAFSFREASLDPRPKYFHEFEENKWELQRGYRDQVRFRPGNLVDPHFLANEPPYDLILCRNLFIYLTPEGRSRALANLDRLLAPGGLLCLTPAEADRLPSNRFVADGPVALAAFKRTAGIIPKSGVMPRSGVIRLAASKPASGIKPLPPPRSDYEHLPLPEPLKMESGVARVPPSRGRKLEALAEGRQLADAGRLDEARAICERAIDSLEPQASLFSLLGVIHLAAGRSDEASAAFRKALYLEPDHPEALSHMIMLSEKRGDSGQAEALRRRLLRLEGGVPS